MSIIETYYLIDFENISDNDLYCSNKLGPHDHIHIFSTENAPKISIKTLSSFHLAAQHSHIVPVKKQSLDMHLVSYLGYLIGKNNSNKCKYIIVSKDTDYDNIISFLHDLSSAVITRQTQIDLTSKRTSSQNSKAVGTIRNNTASTLTKKKVQLNTEVQRAVSTAGYAQPTINKVASIVVKHYGEDKFSSNVHNELREIYTNYLDIYQIIKPIINKYSSLNGRKITTSPQYNSEIQKILSNAKFNNDIISHVASLSCRHHNEQNAKQTIYQSIIARYGQKQGLNIYNHIKSSI